MCQNKPFVGDAAAATEAAALGSNLEACAKVQTSTPECSVFWRSVSLMGTWIYNRQRSCKEQGAGLLSDLSPEQDLNCFRSGLDWSWTWFRPGLHQVWVRFGPGLRHVWIRFWPSFRLDLGQVWTRFRSDLDQVYTKFMPDLDQVWARFGPGLGQFWIRCKPRFRLDLDQV